MFTRTTDSTQTPKVKPQRRKRMVFSRGDGCFLFHSWVLNVHMAGLDYYQCAYCRARKVQGTGYFSPATVHWVTNG